MTKSDTDSDERYIYMLGHRVRYVRYLSVMPCYLLRGNSAVTDRDITDTMT